jgi:UDP-N-acetylglucosamine diphosphorylase/glucosamine-1-phosphate N-acetyltransferase
LSGSGSARRRLVVFDSHLRENFYPLSFTRPTFDLMCGTTTLLRTIETRLGEKASSLIVPKYLESLCKEVHKDATVNEQEVEKCVAVNGLLNPNYPLSSELEKVSSMRSGDYVAVDDEGTPIFAKLDKLRPEALSSKVRVEGIEYAQISIGPSDEKPLLYYPWDLVRENAGVIRGQAEQFTRRIPNKENPYEVLGSRLFVAEGAEIERFVTLDTREGDVVIDEGAIVQSFSHITGPTYIGKGSIIKSARIREGTTIGSNCRVGGEVEQSVLCDYTNKNHEGFIGHSLIGSWVNLGALTTTSDLKNSYGSIKVQVGNSTIRNTNLNKVGCFLGDMVKTSIGALIMSGKTVGVSSQVFGTITEDVPSFTMYGKSLGSTTSEIYLESAIETQRRMMERRGIIMSEHYLEMVKAVFNMTSKNRETRNVRKGRFEF